MRAAPRGGRRVVERADGRDHLGELGGADVLRGERERALSATEGRGLARARERRARREEHLSLRRVLREEGEVGAAHLLREVSR